MLNFSKRLFCNDLTLHFKRSLLFYKTCICRIFHFANYIDLLTEMFLMIFNYILGLCLYYSCVFVYPLYTPSHSGILERNIHILYHRKKEIASRNNLFEYYAFLNI